MNLIQRLVLLIVVVFGIAACGGGATPGEVGTTPGVGGTTPVAAGAALVSIAITPATETVVDQVANFTAIGRYTDESTADITSQVTWVSADVNVATISSATGSTTGAGATGVAAGSTTVTASVNGVTSNPATLIVRARTLTSPTEFTFSKTYNGLFSLIDTITNARVGNLLSAAPGGMLFDKIHDPIYGWVIGPGVITVGQNTYSGGASCESPTTCSTKIHISNNITQMVTSLPLPISVALDTTLYQFFKNADNTRLYMTYITYTPPNAPIPYLHIGAGVAVIDIVNNTLLATIPFINSTPAAGIGNVTGPFVAFFSPDSSRLYLINTLTARLTQLKATDFHFQVVDTVQNTVLPTIPLLRTPTTFTFSPDGSILYLGGIGNILRITTSNNMYNELPFGDDGAKVSGGIRISPDGRVYLQHSGAFPWMPASVIFNEGHPARLAESAAIFYFPSALATNNLQTIFAASQTWSKAKRWLESIYATRVSIVDFSTNTVTRSPASISFPDPPTIDKVTAGNKQISIAFTPPANTGGLLPLTYSVSDNCGVSATIPSINTVVSTPTTVSPLIVSGLTNGKAYQCSVVAKNAVGESAPMGTQRVTPATVPDPPISVSAAGGNASAIVSFIANPAANGGSAILGYTAQCGTASVSGSTSPIIVTGLTNRTVYTCSVTATNLIGSSVPAFAPNSVTPVAQPI